MTGPQQAATRALFAAEIAFLEAYGWERVLPGSRMKHRAAPDTLADYSVADALTLTRADKLRYSVGRLICIA